MNLPNKLTLLRIAMIPALIVVSLITPLQKNIIFETISLGNLIMLIIFILASCTDFLDGYIARKYHLVTDFGKFMDPLADKLLVLAAMIILLEQHKFAVFGFSLGFVVTIILAREFMVTGIRLIAANNHNVIAASKLGKLKTVSQILMIVILFLDGYPFSLFGGNARDWAALIMIGLAGGLTLISGVEYFLKNKKIILTNK